MQVYDIANYHDLVSEEKRTAEGMNYESNEAFDLTSGLALLIVDVAVKGRQIPTEIFALLGCEDGNRKECGAPQSIDL